MALSNIQLQCIKQGGPLEIFKTPKPTSLKPDQILVRQTVVALNALDWKQRDFGILIERWPHVLGIEGAGVVAALGSAVQHFQIGDEVLLWASGMAHGANWGGSYQEFVVMPACYVAKKPRNISIEEAASLPICYNTAVCAINGSLGVPLPFIKGLKSDGVEPKSVLILGGGSNVGAASLQLLRAAFPKMHIFVTSSQKHFDHLSAYGATRVFDYHTKTLPADIEAASLGCGVDVIIDCVGAAAETESLAELFDPSGEKKLVSVLTGSPIPEIDGVQTFTVNGYMLVSLPGGENVIPALTDLVESGLYKVTHPVRSVGHGLEAIANVMDQTKTTSGEKLVVTL